MTGPISPSSSGGGRTALIFGGGLLATLAVVAGLVLLWPSGDGDDDAVRTTPTTVADGKDKGTTTTVEGAEGEPSERTTTTTEPGEPAPVDLFTSGAPEVLAALRSAAGNPVQAIEVSLYPDYAFLAYRDPARPANIDRRAWRAGDVSDADPNPIDDRVDAETEPELFDLAALDLGVIPGLTADATSRFALDVAVTHVIIDRFLPFDDRVLVRVYASPTDGRSGGGYVQYTLDGTFVKVVQ
ncbi:MAG: hypothetical protein ABL966_15335 [Acidimicrobiales bacterium]